MVDSDSDSDSWLVATTPSESDSGSDSDSAPLTGNTSVCRKDIIPMYTVCKDVRM